MKISNITIYLKQAMLELALHYGEGPIMMQSIADNQGVSRKYLDTIFTSLKSNGMVRSRRGIGGGHQLGKAPDTIKVGDILRALEGPLSLVDCVGSADLCSRSHRCVTRDVWTDVGKAIEGVLDGLTLADLVVRHKERNGGHAEGDSGCEIDGVDTEAKAD